MFGTNFTVVINNRDYATHKHLQSLREMLGGYCVNFTVGQVLAVVSAFTELDAKQDGNVILLFNKREKLVATITEYGINYHKTNVDVEHNKILTDNAINKRPNVCALCGGIIHWDEPLIWMERNSNTNSIHLGVDESVYDGSFMFHSECSDNMQGKKVEGT